MASYPTTHGHSLWTSADILFLAEVKTTSGFSRHLGFAMSVISGIPGSAHLCREHWKLPTGYRYLKLSSVSHAAVKYVHFTLAAAILDFWRMLTSCDTGSCTIEMFDTENMGIAVEVLLLCALEFEICLGVKIPPSVQRTFGQASVYFLRRPRKHF